MGSGERKVDSWRLTVDRKIGVKSTLCSFDAGNGDSTSPSVSRKTSLPTAVS